MMGVRYEWADDRQLIMNIYMEQPWTWTEYNAMMAVILPLLRDLNHPCATVVDCSRLGSLPKDGNVLNILMGVEKSMPDNVFASAIVAAPYGATVFMNMLTKLRPSAKVLALFTKTTPEAYEKIYARYAQLQANPDASPPVSVKG